MLPVNWLRLLSLFLCISPHALLAVVVVILCKRRLHREFPCFFAYVLYEIVESIVLFALRFIPSVTGDQYAYAYYATLFLSIALRFGVIDEVSKDLFRESQFLQVAARRSLQCVTGLLFVIGVLLAVYAPGDDSVTLVAGSIVSRGAAMVQCGLLLSLLLFSPFLGLSWRRPTFGIALGLGVLSSVDLAAHALRAEFSSATWVPYLNLGITGTYLVCVSIWIGYLLAPEVEPEFLTDVSRDEVEIWNTELQHLVRQ
jgi:hypothetical protein